ncbi:hypothetical protein BTM25_12370 [Actinomadura rubteroloni]|uniref:WXG100 family type VII secretion target n=1 Tax=Actinomadura rubteroloni TaxID=1926885 RepID=A0A2P4UP96_9ACTN|nr:WXG100 family type VII secretion target [Actinomadura rubteroloni]POM26829.1 hypothetical protein BTM25_12370 [Actinomadura rubteroloni]
MTEHKPKDFPIRRNCMAPQPFKGGMDEMKQILQATDPRAVTRAGQTYNAAASKFNDAAGVLRAQASALKAVWKGDDAEAAIEQMGRLQTSATNLGKTAGETGQALSTYGPQLEWYKQHAPGQGNFAGLTTGDAETFAAGTMIAGPTGGLIAIGGKKLGEALGILDNEEEKAAQEHMKRLTERSVQAHEGLPTNLTTDLPYSNTEYEPPKNPYRGGGGGGGGGGGAHVPTNPYGNNPGGGQHIPTNPYGNHPNGNQHVPNPYGNNHPTNPGGQHVPNPYGGHKPGSSDLAGLPGGGAGGGLGSDPFGGGGGLGGGLGSGGFGGGAGSGVPGGMPGGLGGAGAGLGAGMRGGKPGVGGAGGAPMGGRGGGGGKGEEEHERTTWLTEDEDVWGGNDDDTAPPVIG